MRAYYSVLGLTVFVCACADSPVGPSARRPLTLTGQLVIAGPNQLTAFAACLDGRLVGGKAGSDHADTASGTMEFPIGTGTPQAPAGEIEPGTHELVVVVSRSSNSQGQVTYGVSSGTSRLAVMDRNTDEALDQRILESHQVSVSNYEGLRWTIDVAANGRFRALTASKATAQDVSQRHAACVQRFGAIQPPVS